jgi:hypothetical protein
VDGANALYWKYPIWRLDAEIVRDRMLWASGQLDTKLFGPAVPVKVDDSGQVIAEGDVRRSVYLTFKRTMPISLLQAFDAPVMETNCEYRTSSTAATQSLMLMNSEFVLGQATRLAERVLSETRDVSDYHLWAPAVRSAWRTAYSREPDADELTDAESFCESQLQTMPAANEPADARKQVITNLCHALITSNEFLYVD